ncbi:MAG: MATE family efflux transporter [Pseudomonadota bacterium]
MTVSATVTPRKDAITSELKALLALAWPLIAANIATIGMHTTDVVMTGRLGPEELAANALAVSLIYPFLMFSTGVLLAVAPIVAQSLGARQIRPIRRSARQGLWVGLIICAIVVPLLLQAEPIFLTLNQDPQVAALVGEYMSAAAWSYIPATLFVAFRALSSAHGLTRAIFVITLFGIGANALGNYALMFGNFGLPRLELFGGGVSTTIAQTIMLIAIVGYTLTHRRLRRYALFVRFWKADWPTFATILRLGVPIGLMMAAETSLFAMAGVFIGMIGTDQLAGHAVSLQIISLFFMVPLGIGQASTIRVGMAHGRSDINAVRIAGWTALGVTLSFMIACALIYLVLGLQFIHLFFDPNDPQNAASISFALSYLMVGALFQLVDGGQVSAASILRGLSDTKIPAFVAITGYWLIGMPASYVLAFQLNLGGEGVWLGLALGLALVAVILIARFWAMTRSTS